MENKKEVPQDLFQRITTYRLRFTTRCSRYETPKLTDAPTAAITTVFTISSLRIWSSNTSRVPPRVPTLSFALGERFSMRSGFCFPALCCYLAEQGRSRCSRIETACQLLQQVRFSERRKQHGQAQKGEHKTAHLYPPEENRFGCQHPLINGHKQKIGVKKCCCMCRKQGSRRKQQEGRSKVLL